MLWFWTRKITKFSKKFNFLSNNHVGIIKNEVTTNFSILWNDWLLVFFFLCAVALIWIRFNEHFKKLFTMVRKLQWCRLHLFLQSLFLHLMKSHYPWLTFSVSLQAFSSCVSIVFIFFRLVWVKWKINICYNSHDLNINQ